MYDLSRTVPCSGEIKASDIQNEFTGSNPIGLSEYYGVADDVPTSGQIAYSDFRCKANIPKPPDMPATPKNGGVYVFSNAVYNQRFGYNPNGGTAGGASHTYVGGAFDGNWNTTPNRPDNMRGGTTFLWHGMSAGRNLFSNPPLQMAYTDYRGRYRSKSRDKLDNMNYNAQISWAWICSDSDDPGNEYGTTGPQGRQGNISAREYLDPFGKTLKVQREDVNYGKFSNARSVYTNLAKACSAAGFAHSSNYRWSDIFVYETAGIHPVPGSYLDNEIIITVPTLSPFSSSLSPGSQVLIFVSAMIVNPNFEYPEGGGAFSSENLNSWCINWGVNGVNVSKVEDSDYSLSAMALKYKPGKVSDPFTVRFRPYQDQPASARMITMVSRVKVGFV